MISANYFDGRSARLHPVTLAPGAAGIAVAGDGFARLYSPSQARLGEPFENAPGTLYFADGASCEVPDPAAARALADALGYRKPRAVRWQERWHAVLAALVLLLALVAAAAGWGVPALAERIAAALPVSVDHKLGQGALEALQKDILEPTRFSQQRLVQIDQVLRSILPPRTRVPVRLLVAASPQLGINALALPDGTIIVTDEMVRYILGKSQDFSPVQTAQLAGVLAHEIGHLERRHSTRTLARTSLTAAGSAALFGDFSAVAAALPAMLMNLRYSREMETEADDYALALLRRHGMSGAPLADLFDSLDADFKNDPRRVLPRWMANSIDFASSHPSNAQRSARLRAGP